MRFARGRSSCVACVPYPSIQKLMSILLQWYHMCLISNRAAPRSQANNIPTSFYIFFEYSHLYY